MKGTVKLSIIIFLLLVSVSAVVAVDNNQTDIQSGDSKVILTQDDSSESQLSSDSHDVGGYDFKSIQDVIDSAKDGDVIYLGGKTFNSKGQTIMVNKLVTIAGGFRDNGNVYATLDGEKQSRIMEISANVTLKGITFVNGNASDSGYGYNGNGGAIFVNNYNNLSVLNCTFNNNTAVGSGGAIFSNYKAFFSCEDCVFNFNHADSSGGAMNGDSAVDCVFNFNHANFGGAMVGRSAVGCVFNFNHANFGGAMWEGSAVDCVFYNNSAGSNGGAMLRGSAVDCVFYNNSAGSNGGAMDGGSAVNCVFNFNHANFGGAMWGGSAVNCVFYNNSASGWGGAMMGGSADSCIFTGDGTEGVSTISDPFLRVFNYTSVYNSGGRLRFNLTSNGGIPILNRNIAVDIFKDNGKIGTFNCLSGEALSITLDAGSYVAVCRASDYGINPVNLTLTITKANSKIVASPITVTYNSNRYLTITLRDERNNPVSGADLSININGIKKFITDKNGQIKVPTNNLAPKKYAVKITVVDSNYLKSESSVKLTVKKAASKITAKKKTFKKSSKVKKYTVTLKSGKTPIKKVKVTLKIAKKTFKAKTNNKGKAVFKVKLGAGKYKATVKFNGNKYYNKSTGKVTITVK